MTDEKIKVLIVDDETDIEPLFRQKFKNEMREGIVEFRFCFSGESALEYMNELDAADIVLILSDINMPGMSGLELLKTIKDNYSYLKVYMITAYDDETKYKTAIQYGADEYLTKPIDFEKLKKKILLIKSENK
jgi:CheY-like chemotaxis protein